AAVDCGRDGPAVRSDAGARGVDPRRMASRVCQSGVGGAPPRRSGGRRQGGRLRGDGMARGRSNDPVSSAREALAKLAEEKPWLAASCEVLREMLPALVGEPVVETPPALDAAMAHDKLAAGIPLLRGEPVALDAKSLARRWQAVCAAVERRNPDARRIAAGFAALDPTALLSEVLAGRSEGVPARAEALGLDGALAATVLRLSTLPVLA